MSRCAHSPSIAPDLSPAENDNVFQCKLIMHVSNIICSTMSTGFIHIADLLIGQEMLWEETLADDPETELNARRGELTQLN